MADPEGRAFRANVHGRVQGVGFRWSAIRQAKTLRLRGTVANRADGSVEVIAEGASKELALFIAWLEKGPPGSHVSRVDLEWIAPTGSYEEFTVEF